MLLYRQQTKQNATNFLYKWRRNLFASRLCYAQTQLSDGDSVCCSGKIVLAQFHVYVVRYLFYTILVIHYIEMALDQTNSCLSRVTMFICFIFMISWWSHRSVLCLYFKVEIDNINTSVNNRCQVLNVCLMSSNDTYWIQYYILVLLKKMS